MTEINVYKTGIKNIIYSIISQGISFILSIVTGFYLPKALGVEGFGYWQVYLLYVNYIMFFCFGFNDGLYLRYGSFDYEKLPFERIRSAMRIFITINIFLFCLLSFLSLLEHDIKKVFALFAVSLNLLILGINGTLLTILQFTNRIKLYSILTIANKACFVFIIIIMLFTNYINFKLVIVADIIAKLIIICFNIYKSKELFFGKAESFSVGYKEYLDNIVVGIQLMLAYIVSSLLMGIGMIIVERFMPLKIFSLYSFATNIISFVLAFIYTSSLSLYPLLKRVPIEKIDVYYENINKLLCAILFILLVGYYPIYYLVKHRFVAFVDMFDYFYLFFVIIIFQGKMQFLINTYYKVLREERAMLFANISAVVVALIIIIPMFYYTRSILAIVIGTSITLLWRCYASEIYLKNKMGIKTFDNIIVEILMIFIFIFGVMINKGILGLNIYILAIFVYLLMHRRVIFSYTKQILKLFKELPI